MKYIFFLLLIFFFAAFSQAQTDPRAPLDFVIFGDTAQKTGVVKFDPKTNALQFRSKFSSIFKTYTIDQVSQFKSGLNRYFRKNVDNQTTYAKRLVKGDVSFYGLTGAFLVETDDDLKVITKSNYAAFFEELYQDRCEWSFNKKTLKFSTVYLTHLIDGYNKKECFKMQSDPIALKVGFGGAKTTFKENASPLIAFESSTTSSIFLIGLMKELRLYQNKSIIFYSDFYSQSLSASSLGVELRRDIKSLLIGLMPRFYFGDAYFNIGINSGLALSKNSSANANNLETPLNDSSFSMGYRVGIGYRVVEKENFVFDLELNNQRWGNRAIRNSSNSLNVYFGF